MTPNEWDDAEARDLALDDHLDLLPADERDRILQVERGGQA